MNNEDKREAVEFLRTHWCEWCSYEDRNVRDKTVAYCRRCIMASRTLFGNDDALCYLDSSGQGTWQRLAELIEGKN